MTETPTFRILRHGAATIVKTAESAYDSWARGDFAAALSDLDQIAADAEALSQQARGMSTAAKASMVSPSRREVPTSQH